MPTPAHILSVATAVPECAVTSDDVKTYFPKAFALDERRLAGIHAVIDHARIDKRHFLFPLDYTITPRSLEQTSCEYKTHAVRLSQIVAEQALAQAQLTPRDIDFIIAVSCTGLMVPSIDAHLVNLMGFRTDVKRLPITELGCAAGASALARAADYIRAFPDANVLVIAVELPSLTLQCKDLSPANLISCCLFGDGAAAVVLSGRPQAKPGLTILDVRSHIRPDSIDAMGLELRDSGLHVFLSKHVPRLVRDEISEVTQALLSRSALTRADMEFYLLHPGGQKLIKFIEEEFQLTEADTVHSWTTLAEYGNLSAASILYVIDEFLKHPPPRAGALGLLAAFGPGFSTEMALMQWI